jgi:hypothetical protein
MTAYQATSEVASTSVPQPTPSPSLAAPGVGESGAQLRATESAAALSFTDPIEELLSGSEHFLGMYRALKELVTNPIGTIYQIIVDFATSPSTALVTWQPLMFVFAYAATFAVMGTPIYAAVAGAAAGVALPLALGLAGMAQAYDIPVGEPAAAAVSPPAEQPSAVAMAGTPATTASAAPPPAPAPAAGVSATATAPAPMTAGAEGAGYAIRGDGPGFGFGPPMRHGAAAPAQASSGAQAASAAAALASGRAKSRSRKHRATDVRERGYRYEFMTMDDTPAPLSSDETTPVAASSTGAGTLGASATGLATLTADAFGNGTTVPMMPASWGTDPDTDEPRQ